MAPLAGQGTAAYDPDGDVIGCLCEPPLGRMSSAASTGQNLRKALKTTLVLFHVHMAELQQIARYAHACGMVSGKGGGGDGEREMHV